MPSSCGQYASAGQLLPLNELARTETSSDANCVVAAGYRAFARRQAHPEAEGLRRKATRRGGTDKPVPGQQRPPNGWRGLRREKQAPPTDAVSGTEAAAAVVRRAAAPQGWT